MMSIQANRVTTFDYSLRTQNGEVVDKASEYVYLHGYSNLLPGMVAALDGKTAGDKIQTELAPASTFGEIMDVEPLRVHRREFGPQFDQLQYGMALKSQDESGQVITYFVQAKQGAYATLSRNHPLAGVPLIFEASIIDVRSALPEELADKRAYGRHGDKKPTSCACC